MIGLTTTARHDREIAAKDEQIAGLMKRLDGQEAIADRLHHALWLADAAEQRLCTELTKWKRPRGADGRFM